MKTTIKYFLSLTAILASNAWGGVEFSNVRIGGFFSNGYLQSSHYNYPADTEDGTFEFAELGLNASWTPKDRMTVNGQLFAFELGRYGNYDALLDYLFLDYNVDRSFGFRLGRIKRESGIYTHVQDIDLSRTSVLLPIGIYDQRFRDFSAALDGGSFYGNVDLWENAYLDYNVYGGYVELQPDGGVAGVALTTLSRFADDTSITSIDSDSIYGVQFWVSPGLEGLRFGAGLSEIPGISASVTGTLSNLIQNPYLAGQPIYSDFSDFGLKISQYSVEYFVGDWNFVGEYVVTGNRYDTVAKVGSFPATKDTVDIERAAWYVGVSRRLGSIEGAITFVRNESEDGDILGNSGEGSTGTDDVQFSLRYDATDHWTLKAEIHSITGTSRLFNEYYQNPILTEQSWTLFAAKSTFFF